MKSALTAGLVASALFVQQAATTSWGDQPSFSSPSNSNNNCTVDQGKGFDWGKLPTGGFNNYDGFDFGGFDCKDSFQPKDKRRSLQTRTNFQSKCIQGTLPKGGGSGPKISSGKGDKFSISHFDISVGFDTDVEFIFSMPDGSKCKHTSPCKAGGTTVKNTQCGGAHEVTFNLPPKNGGNKDCDIGFHSIGFDCHSTSTTSSTTKATSTTTKLTTTTSKVLTTTTPLTTQPVTTTSKPGEQPPPPPSTTTTSKVGEQPPPPPSTTTTTKGGELPPPPPVTTTTSKGGDIPPPPPVTTTTSVTVDAPPPPSTSTTTKPGDLPPPPPVTTTTTKGGELPPPPVTTTTTKGGELPPPPPVTTTTTKGGELPPPPPVTTTTTKGGELPPPPPVTTTTTKAGELPPPPPPPETTTTTKGGELPPPPPVTTTTTSKAGEQPPPPPTSLTSFTLPPFSSSTTVGTSSSALPPPPPTEDESPCPPVLPRCLNTWLKVVSSVSKCASNSDHACFCPSAEFIANVQDCVSSWGQSDDEVTGALSYLAGICADFVPQNPGICTGVPKTITLVPQVPQTQTATVTNGNGRGSRPPVGVPTGGFNVPVTTLTFTQTLEGSTITNVVTVPQVTFITNEATGTATAPGVGLVPFVPALATGTGSGSPSGAGNGDGAGPVASTAVAPTGTGATAQATGTTPQIFTGAASRQSVCFGVIAGLVGVIAFVI